MGLSSVRDVAPVVATVPAVGTAVHVLRTVTAAVASRLPLSIDEVDDLRLAVDEAAARLLLLPDRRSLVLEVAFPRDGLELTIVAVGPPAPWPDPDHEASLPWRILTALAERVAFEERSGAAAIVLFRRLPGREVHA